MTQIRSSQENFIMRCLNSISFFYPIRTLPPRLRSTYSGLMLPDPKYVLSLASQPKGQWRGQCGPQSPSHQKSRQILNSSQNTEIALSSHPVFDVFLTSYRKKFWNRLLKFILYIKNIFYPDPPTPFIEEQLHSPTAPCSTDPLVLPLANSLCPKGRWKG